MGRSSTKKSGKRRKTGGQTRASQGSPSSRRPTSKRRPNPSGGQATDGFGRWLLEAVVSGRVLRKLLSESIGPRVTAATESILRELAVEDGMEALAAIEPDRRLSDKYMVPPAPVPCSEKATVCRGVCCYRPKFALTLQDIVEGTVKFSLEAPYRIAVCEDGYCVHFDRTTYQCKIWDKRPAICRSFNCLRIPEWWEHFRKGIPGPKLLSVLEESKESGVGAGTVRRHSSIQPGPNADPDTQAYHVFQRDGDRLLYDLGTGNILGIDEVAYDILKDGGDGSLALSKYPAEEVTRTLGEIERLKLTGHFHGYEIPDPEKRQEIHESLWRHHPRSLFFYVSQACNMGCAYCYAENNGSNEVGRLATFQEAKRVVDHLVRASGRRPNLSITFFGGEPLLNFPVVEATVKYCRSIEKEKKKRFDFRLSTNGTLLNKDIISFLVKHGFGMLVSLDGPPEIHDRVRRMRDGSPSHAMILEKAKQLCDAFGDPRAVKVRANITRLAPDIEGIVNYLQGCGFGKIGIATVMDTPGGNSDLSITREQGERLFEWRLAQIPRFLESLVTGQRLPYDPWGQTLRDFGHRGSIRGPTCGVGRNSNGISSDGTIYPCHRFVGMEGFALGNVRSGLNRQSVMEFYKRCADTASSEECSRCWARRVCLGGCPWERAVPGGEFVCSATEYCSRGLRALEATMHLYVKVRDSVPEFFDRPGELSHALPADGSRPLSW